jgi:hypothetical protein
MVCTNMGGCWFTQGLGGHLYYIYEKYFLALCTYKRPLVGVRCLSLLTTHNLPMFKLIVIFDLILYDGFKARRWEHS